ncbi:MAG: hypothetical protein ACFFDT_23400, partial [Candidatus Hodarchaeota archaeon]
KNNPIVTPQNQGITWYENGVLNIGAIFNGGAEIFQDKIVLTPRVPRGYNRVLIFDEKIGIERFIIENYLSEVWVLTSKDGLNFAPKANGVIKGNGRDHQDFIYGIEDTRIIKIGQKYLLIGVGRNKPAFKGVEGDRTALYSTEDFKAIKYHGCINSFHVRNTVILPEPISGHYYALFRFRPDIQLTVLEGGIRQLLNPSKYESEWKKILADRDRNILMQTGIYPHETEKIGPGPQIKKTRRGWLFIYHAVGEIIPDICKVYGLREKINRAYSISAALLDLQNPRKVLCRTRNPIYIPSLPHELYGDEHYPVDIPAVVFPTGAIVRQDKLLLYCGAGDKYMILLSCKLDNLVDYLWKFCKVEE